MFITTILLAVITILIIKWYRDRRYKLELFQRIGVPGPTPSLFLGNFGELITKGFKFGMDNWTEKYGRIFGYYEGEVPILVVSEPEYVKQIAIKEFHKFHSHRQMPADERSHEKRNIFNAEGHRWKQIRTLASPAFTAKRMKEMSPLINNCVDDLLELFDEHSKKGEAFNIHSDFSRLTLDAIYSCALGIDSGSIKDGKSKFLLEAKKFLDCVDKPPLRVQLVVPLCIIFPGITNYLRQWTFFDDALSYSPHWLMNMGKKVLSERRNDLSAASRIDFLGCLMKGKPHGIQEEEIKLLSSPGNDDDENFKPLTDDEIAAQIAGITVAGYETTSTALGFTAYELALNPDVQEKLQAEIDEYFPDRDMRPDYTTVHQLPYLEAVMKEVLRFYPIVPIGANRNCFEETKVGDITIPKGMSIQLNMDVLHFRPDLWGKHDPKKFVPERFLEDCQDAHSKMAWIPFGVGPRMCFGMRFAQMKYKITLARILKNFSFTKCSETKIPLPLKKYGIHSPSEGVYIILGRRQ